jgi:hypothetical protein
MLFLSGITATQPVIVHGRNVALVCGLPKPSSSLIVAIALQSDGVHRWSVTVFSGLLQPLLSLVNR